MALPCCRLYQVLPMITATASSRGSVERGKGAFLSSYIFQRYIGASRIVRCVEEIVHGKHSEDKGRVRASEVKSTFRNPLVRAHLQGTNSKQFSRRDSFSRFQPLTPIDIRLRYGTDRLARTCRNQAARTSISCYSINRKAISRCRIHRQC
jgi:hypothetical protein